MPGYFLPPRLVQLMHLRPARTREMVGGREGGCLGNNYDDNYVDRCCQFPIINSPPALQTAMNQA